MFNFFDLNSECFGKHDAFCSHIFDYACLRRRLRLIAIEEVRNHGKIVTCTLKTFLKMAGGGCIPFIPPPGSAPGHKLQEQSKECGIFQALGTISFVLFYKKENEKGGGHGTMPP